MNVTTDHANGIAIVRVGESRLMYPLLSEFASAVTQLLGSGERKIIVDLSSVGYVDSATIGCLMDLYRQASAAGGSSAGTSSSMGFSTISWLSSSASSSVDIGSSLIACCRDGVRMSFWTSRACSFW